MFSRSTTMIATIFIATPSFAFAGENTPASIVLGTIGMLAISALVLVVALNAEKGASDPSNSNYATADNIFQKLSQTIDSRGVYSLSVIRQSGNIQRTYDRVTFNEAVAQISQTMRRAKIDTVAISTSGNKTQIFRTVHNGRGRQEGKRIGGFELIKLN